MRSLILAKLSSNHSRWAFAAALFGCVAVACQDGPNQTYSPPPPNAAWNDGRQVLNDAGVIAVPDGTATGATAPFVNDGGSAISAGGNNANEICTQLQIAAITPLIDSAPILPPNGAARLNLAGSDGDGGVTWEGLTIQQAEAINCQGVSQSDVLGYGTSDLDVLWDNGAVYTAYSIATDKLQQITLVAPYGGKLVATSLDGSTVYTISVDGVTPITVSVNGGPTSSLSLDWLDAANGVPSAVAVFDQIYRALMATYMPTYPPEPANLTCNQTGDCILGAFPSDQEGYIGISPMDMFLSAGPYSIPTYANAIQEIDIQFSQVMNYSPANPVLKLDASGPGTLPLSLGGAAPCQLSLGLNYNDFLANCINVSTSTDANTSEVLELYSQFSHDEETFQFDISGVDPSFADSRLTQTQTVIDPPPGGCPANPSAAQCPQQGDTQFELWIDQFTLGLFANDWQYDSSGNPTLHDLHGAGALYNDFRTLSLINLEAEVCANVTLPPPPPVPDAGVDGGVDGGADAGDPPGDPPAVSPLAAECGAWAANPANTAAGLAAQIQSCVAPRDPATGLLANDPTQFQPVGCTGIEDLLSADITTVDDPVNVGPIASQINPDYELGMKMGHQQGSFCADAMSRSQIAALSYTMLCPGGATSCAPLPAPAFTQVCPGGVGSCLVPGGAPFTCGAGTCDPSQGHCPAGTATCTLSAGTNPTPLTVADVDYIGSVGVGGFLLNPSNSNPAVPAPAGTQVVLALPYVCTANNLLSQTYEQVLASVVNGVETSLPIAVQGGISGSPSPRFFFQQYGNALVQTLEATNSSGALTAPVAKWGPPALGSLIPVRPSDLYFDSVGDGQFEIMEYVDRRFVCPDGANDCAPVGSTSFTCPFNTCTFGSSSCTAGQPTCNAGETAQAPLDIQFIADVKDGIMNSYDFNRYMYRGETALYQMIQPEGYATAQASNALISNMFGSPLIQALGGVPPNLLDLTGQPIAPSDYAAAAAGSGPLMLSYQQQATSPIGVSTTFAGSAQALVTYPIGKTAAQTLIPWAPYQPGIGFDEAFYGNSALDFFIQTANIDLSGISTDIVLDYNFSPPSAQTGTNVEAMSAESQDYLGDVFMCWEPAANPPLLAVPMYTPTQAVLNWLNSVPSSYADCGIVVRWSPYDNYVNLIESTAYGVRLQVTQGGGLGRIVGATLYVPNLPYED
jgi:hypothetical protein